MKLLLIRHAQSANNLLYAQTGSSEGRFPDPELSELGHRQAQRLAHWALNDETLGNLTHLYSSLTTRAVQTAAPLADALALSVQGLANAYECGGVFRRLDSGEREPVAGRTLNDLQSECPNLRWPTHLPESHPWPGGFEAEEHEVYTQRAKNVIETLRDTHSPQDRVALVTHQYFAQFLLAQITRSHEGWFRINNTATTQLEFGPDYNVIHWVNRQDHLSAELVSN